MTVDDALAAWETARGRYMRAEQNLREVCPDYPHVPSRMTCEQAEAQIAKVDAQRALAEAHVAVGWAWASQPDVGCVTPPLL